MEEVYKKEEDYKKEELDKNSLDPFSKTVIAKETREYKTLSRSIIQIGRAKFDYISPTMLSYNWTIINVEISREPLYVKFIDIELLKDILSPEDFISLNRLYKFDKHIHIESEDFVFIPDTPLNTIRDRVLQFIEKQGGKYSYGDDSDEDDEFIMCTYKSMIVCFNFVPIKGGYIVEIEKAVKLINYSIQYYNMVKTFLRKFS
jgi:hypothetical protein